jgi:hypothetical protein
MKPLRIIDRVLNPTEKASRRRRGRPWPGWRRWGAGILAGSIALLPRAAEAQFNPCGETNPVKFLAPPAGNGGTDVQASRGLILADDFFCNETGPITGIHLWGSWLNDRSGFITNFWLAIYNDIPASNSVPSHPGTNLLWQQSFNASQYCVTNAFSANECFFNPSNRLFLGADSNVYFYTFFPTNPFTQHGTPANPTNYWLAVYAQSSDTNTFGWKTSDSRYNDAAVWIPANGSGQPRNGFSWSSITNLACQGTNHALVDLAFRLNGTNSGALCCSEGPGVKQVQYPDLTNGFSLLDTYSPPNPFWGVPWIVADDFSCTTPGPITDIHLWGSWQGDQVNYAATYTLTIWSDISNLGAPGPGQVLWTQTFVSG